MTQTIGRELLATRSVSEALALEKSAGKSEHFVALDALVARLVHASLEGEQIACLSHDRARGTSLALPGLSEEDAVWVQEHFRLEHLQSRGMWKIPERASLKVGFLSLPYAVDQYGRYGAQMAAEERGPVPLDTAEAIFVWSVLQPLFTALYRPIELRTLRAGEGSRSEQLVYWADCESFYQDLGLKAKPSLAKIRYGGGWSKLSGAERHAALTTLLGELQSNVQGEEGARFRIRRARPLIERYYAKAKVGGAALAKRVVTNALRGVLVGTWSGSWIAFIDYLGERLHPNEQVITAVPSVELSLPSKSLSAIAEEEDLPAEAVAAVAAAVFGENPVEKRVQCMKAFWAAFDELHAKQRSEMRPLWGLVDDGFLGPSFNAAPFQPGLYREVLNPDLCSSIDELWGGRMRPRFPGKILTEWSAHAQMASAFGPALKFWEGVALTAWFVCEGPTSRTDLSSLADYHAKEVAALRDAGMPIDPAIFSELGAAEERLGPPETVWDDEEPESISSGGTGITISVRMGRGSRRSGFVAVRDIVTRHRKVWAEQYLEAYLRARWENELRAAGETFLVLVNQRQGKPPTPKQFSRKAAEATNYWLGGNISVLYRLLKENCPLQVEDARALRVPAHVATLRLHSAFTNLLREGPLTEMADRENTEYAASRLLRDGVKYVHYLEGSGSPPEPERLKEFSRLSAQLAADSREAWGLFVAATEEACFTKVEAGAYQRSARQDAEKSPVVQSRQSYAREENTKRVPWWRRLFGR